MTPDRMRQAAQILGEFGNGKMANELIALADHTEKGSVHLGALAAVEALKQANDARESLRIAIKQVRDYERELKRGKRGATQ